MFKICWLTTNRNCNIRCKWCYARDTKYNINDCMSLDNAKKAIDICAEAGIKKIILIGGEPLLYPYLYDVLDYCHEKEIKTTIVTNGILLSDIEFAKECISHYVHNFSISLKGSSSEAYRSLCGMDAFDKVIAAVRNLSVLQAHFSIGTVLTNENMDNFIDGVKASRDAGAKNFAFSFCYNFNCGDNSNIEYLSKNNPYVLAKRFSERYPVLKKELEGCHMSIAQSLPFCVYEEEELKTMFDDKNANFACQVLTKGGLLFDTDLSLIPCNAMYKIKFGKYGVDFSDYPGLIKHFNSPEVLKMFSKLRGLPDNECKECKNLSQCAGGCILNWTNYSFEELKTKIKNDAIKTDMK